MDDMLSVQRVQCQTSDSGLRKGRYQFNNGFQPRPSLTLRMRIPPSSNTVIELHNMSKANHRDQSWYSNKPNASSHNSKRVKTTRRGEFQIVSLVHHPVPRYRDTQPFYPKTYMETTPRILPNMIPSDVLLCCRLLQD